MLEQRLTQCCRNHDVSPPNAAKTPEASPVLTASNRLPGEEVVEGAGIFVAQAEESADEAIIDTGASRTVVGEDRLREMIKCFPPEIRRAIQRVETSGVT